MDTDRIYVRGFPKEFTEKDLKQAFSEYGEIRIGYVVNESEIKAGNKNPRHYGIIRFRKPESAKEAVDAYNKKEPGQEKWTVALCQKILQRKMLFKNQFLIECNNYQKANLFVKDFPQNWTEEQLREVFGKYGTIQSMKVNEGKAYVWLSSNEEAKNAIANENKKEYEGNKLFVCVWVQKSRLGVKIASKRALRRIESKPS